MPPTRNGTKRPREPSLQLSAGVGRTVRRIGGRPRGRDSDPGGAVLEIPPSVRLAPNSDTPRTPLGGQFDWGGRLQKGNGGFQRSPQHVWQPCVERNGRRGLDCEADEPDRCESRA